MVVVEDFTRVSAGRDIPAERRVQRCPRCGRSGVEEHSQERLLFVHTQISEVLGDGMRTEPRDCCALPRP